MAGMLLRLNVNRSHQPAILARRQIRPGAHVRVIKAKARRLLHKGDASAPVGRDERRALFGCSIDICGDELSVPMELLRRVRLVVDLNRYSLPFLEAQQRSRKLSVVSGDRDDPVWREFDGRSSNRQSVVNRAAADLSSRSILLSRGLA